MNDAHLLEIFKNRNDYTPRTKHWGDDGLPKYTNELVLSQSPYLLQHAHNPVDWRMWSPETFADAQSLNRPIFLSIGYSTCHWCHVMEYESFEDEEIAKHLNESFISIKVDREEHPEIDSVYMDFVQITTGKGGWPMSLFLTPEKRPLFAGTYFPPRDGDRGIQMGFLSYVKMLSVNWSHPKLQEQGEQPIQVLKHYSLRPPKSHLSAEWIEVAADHWISMFDEDWGGFSSAPKFPRPAMLEALLKSWHRSGDSSHLKAVEITLERMYCGGIYDHIGGGFARYSVDNRWWVPHFEKMLYDNAQLISVYLEAYQITKRELYADIARDIMNYLIQEMSSPKGPLYTATDADSMTPKGDMVEGYFFTWTYSELQNLCTEEELTWVSTTFGITPEGNFEEGRNIFRLYEPLDDEEKAYWAPIRAKLYTARSQRSHPQLDDKIICVWNAMGISAFARAAAILGEVKWKDQAQDIADFILTHMWNGEKLLRVWRANQSGNIQGVLEDYMGLCYALLDLFEVTGELRYLEKTKEIYEAAESFFDAERGGFFRCSSESRDDLPFHEKPLIDGSEPSGNSYAALVGLKLHHITDKPHYRAQADSTLKAIASLMSEQPIACPKSLCALSQSLESRSQIVLIQLPEGESTLNHSLTRTAWLSYHPYMLRLSLRHIDEAYRSNIPALRGRVQSVNTPHALICSTRGCTPSISNSSTLRSALTKLN